MRPRGDPEETPTMYYAFLTALVAVCIAAIAVGFAFGCRMPEGD